MSISVTNSGATIYIDDGSQIVRVNKDKVAVESFDDTVRITWGTSGQYMQANYADFTAPTGASATAVGAAIEAFLDAAAVEDTVLAAGTANVGIVGSNIISSVTIVRPANTTAYAVNDVMNNGTDTTPLSFSIARSNNLRGWNIGGICVSNAAQATLPNIDLLLFSSTFTIAADNAAFAPTFAQMQTYLGKIRFSTWVSRGVRSDSDGSVENSFVFSPASGTQIIYGVLVLQNAYTPISEENLQISVFAEQY